jgi:secreted protein with Ig-like and vWFA domain
MADYNSSFTGAQIDAAITKVGGIEAGADVTDTTNVTAAGALMDSEVTNLADVKAFDPANYATAAQGALADSATQPADIANMVESDPTGVTGADAITNIISLTTAEYGAITPDAATLYVITD